MGCTWLKKLKGLPYYFQKIEHCNINNILNVNDSHPSSVRLGLCDSYSTESWVSNVKDLSAFSLEFWKS